MNGDNPRYAGVSETHAVTCCSDLPRVGFAAPVGNCTVYAERDAGGLNCNLDANFSSAAGFCQSVGARLCTSRELVLGCGSGLGCAANNRMVWSSSFNPVCHPQPTAAPTTFAPTQAPTIANTECGYAVQCGRANACVGGNRYADPSELHEGECFSHPRIVQGIAVDLTLGFHLQSRAAWTTRRPPTLR